MTRSVQKYHLHKPAIPWGGGPGGKFPKSFWQGYAWNVHICTQKSCLSTPTLLGVGVWGSVPLYFFLGIK